MAGNGHHKCWSHCFMEIFYQVTPETSKPWEYDKTTKAPAILMLDISAWTITLEHLSKIKPVVKGWNQACDLASYVWESDSWRDEQEWRNRKAAYPQIVVPDLWWQLGAPPLRVKIHSGLDAAGTTLSAWMQRQTYRPWRSTTYCTDPSTHPNASQSVILTLRMSITRFKRSLSSCMPVTKAKKEVETKNLSTGQPQTPDCVSTRRTKHQACKRSDMVLHDLSSYCTVFHPPASLSMRNWGARKHFWFSLSQLFYYTHVICFLNDSCGYDLRASASTSVNGEWKL